MKKDPMNNSRIKKKLHSDYEFLEGISRGLSHDVLSLITPIDTYFSYIKNYPDKAKELEEISANNIKLLSQIISDARIFTISNKLIKSPSHLKDIADYAIRSLASLTTKRKIKFKMEVDSEITLLVNFILIQRLLTNVLKNCIESNATEIIICSEIIFTKKNKVCNIKIIDNGDGIEKSNLSKIFQQGYSTKKSSGLGFTIVKKIIDLHNGTIDVSSKVKEGTKIIISLPIN